MRSNQPSRADQNSLPFQFNDGGRTNAGRTGRAGDCVCRSVAIATGRPYAEVYAELAEGNATQRTTKRSGSHSGVRTASQGINTDRKWFAEYMAAHGFTWTPTMRIGSGCTTHLAAGELPSTGRHVVKVSKHCVALIDGVMHDTHDPSRGGTRCVYGYWTLDEHDARIAKESEQ